MVSHARGPEFESASGLHPPCWRNLAWSYTSRLGPVARRQVSSCLTVSLDTGLSHLQLGISIDDAFYPWWDLDVLSNERRLAGDCRCRYDSRAAEDVLGVVGCSNQNISTCPLSGPRSFNVNPCHIPLGLTKTTMAFMLEGSTRNRVNPALRFSSAAGALYHATHPSTFLP